LSTETLTVVLSIALAVLLTVMAGLLFALFRRGRTGAVPPASVAAAPPGAALPEPALVSPPEVIASMAEREPERGYERYFEAPREPEGYAESYPERERERHDEAVPGFEPAPAPEDGILHILTDPATGLDNRWAWDRMVHEENQRKRRYSRPISVVVAELYGIDNLAQRVGREAADRLIFAIGEALRRYSRSCDRIARVDNARFYILLPETDEASVVHFIERVRRACDLWLEAGAVALHLSMGWATSGPDEPIEAAMVTARERLITDFRRRAGRAG
jgi:diguanylate cyclase (GGDEF)-like protein